MHNLPFPLLAETVGERFAGAGMTVLIGLVVVFSVLILLTFIFFLFGKVVGRGKTPKKPSAPVKKAEPAVQPAAVPRTVPAPVVEDGISEEVVAVIAAAVSAHGRSRQHPIPSAASSAAVRTVPFGRRPGWRRIPVLSDPFLPLH